MRVSIDENKWYLSEQAGRDVGLTFAKMDFIDNHLDRVIGEFRCRYCGTRCEVRNDCALAERVGEIPSLRTRQARLN